MGNKASGAAISIPFTIVKGALPGPTLWINGQVHGNEVCAMVAAIAFCRSIDPSALKGTVVFTATGNPLAFDGRTMFSPQDWSNLDQSFPGRADGWITERLAHALMTEVLAVQPRVLISMHSQGSECESKTYAVFKLPPGSQVQPESLFPFIRVFDPFVVCRMSVAPGSGEIVGNHAGALDYQAMAHGIPSFMIELGIGQRATDDDVEKGVRAFSEVARQLKMLSGEESTHANDTSLVTARGHVTVGSGGFFRSQCRAGDLVPAGQALGWVMDLYGETIEQVILDHDIRIIALRVDPVVHSGDNVAYVAHQWEALSLGSKPS